MTRLDTGASISVVMSTDSQDSGVRTIANLMVRAKQEGLSGSGVSPRRSGGTEVETLSASSRSLSEVDNALRAMQAQREIIYRQLAVENHLQMETFEEKLTHRVGTNARIVGSVGVVTTGFSVGYLLWVVRGGMLLSGVLAQIPAWTMLDPLLVIDGNPRDDDKESLQTIMDRQQAKLTAKTPPSVAIGQQHSVVKRTDA